MSNKVSIFDLFSAIFSLIGLMMILGTVLDSFFRQSILKTNRETDVFRAFSIYTNSLALFKLEQSKSAIQCLNGLRFLGMLMIIVGHTYLMSPQYPLGKAEDPPHLTLSGPPDLTFLNPFLTSEVNTFSSFKWLDNVFLQVILNATVWVDTFFLLSGLLMAYIGLKGFYKIKIEVTKATSRAHKIKIWLSTIGLLYFHRIFRITPTMMLMICLGLLWNSRGDGPNWPLFQQQVLQDCEHYWWTNLLYIGNFMPLDKRVGYLDH